jgi:hypothetical protein
MKHTLRSIGAAALALVAVQLAHAEKVVAGPKGGRLLDAVPAKAEFFVNADQRVEVVFYDASLKPVAPDGQVVAVTAEAPGGRTVLEIEKTAEGYVSKAPLPAGAPYRVVVQIRAAAGEKPQNFRIDLNLGICGGCSRPEYGWAGFWRPRLCGL